MNNKQEERRAHNAVTIDKIQEKCRQINLEYISFYQGTYCGDKATIVQFICPAHKDKGVQEKDWEHFRKLKKGCVFCTGRHKTTEDFKKEIYAKQPDIEILNEYTGSATQNRIYCKCKICGYEWDTAPASLRNGSGCPQCAIEKRRKNGRIKFQEKFIKDLKTVQPNLKVLSNYNGTHKFIKCKCLIHNIEWESIPANLLNDTSHCPECTKEKGFKKVADRHNDFVDKLSNFRQDIEVLENYIGYHKKILCKCKKHNEHFYASPATLFDGHSSCPSCQSDEGKMSHGERLILKFLNYNNIPYIYEHIFDDCKNILPLRFDFFLPKHNMCIEYDGEQHFRPVIFRENFNGEAEKQYFDCVKRDRIKNDYCEKNGITLIRIPYWERKNITQILEEHIRHLDPQRLSYPA